MTEKLTLIEIIYALISSGIVIFIFYFAYKLYQNNKEMCKLTFTDDELNDIMDGKL